MLVDGLALVSDAVLGAHLHLLLIPVQLFRGAALLSRGLWPLLARMACGRFNASHWTVVVLAILLSDIPRAGWAVHPLAEVFLHVLLVERLSVDIQGEERLSSV